MREFYVFFLCISEKDSESVQNTPVGSVFNKAEVVKLSGVVRSHFLLGTQIRPKDTPVLRLNYFVLEVYRYWQTLNS